MKKIYLLLLLPMALHAQQPARGTFNYRVDGIYEGQAMPPWSATSTIADSANAWVLTHTVHQGPTTRYEYRYSQTFAHWLDQGRMSTSECKSTITTEVPEYALPFYFAARAKVAERVSLVMLKCRDGAIQRVNISGDVVVEKDGFLIKGDKDYPFEINISNDRRVLRFVQPQGTVGIAIYTLQ